MTTKGLKDLKQAMQDGHDGARMEGEQEAKRAMKKEKEKQKMNIPSKVFGVETCMAPSGKEGGTRIGRTSMWDLQGQPAGPEGI